MELPNRNRSHVSQCDTNDLKRQGERARRKLVGLYHKRHLVRLIIFGCKPGNISSTPGRTVIDTPINDSRVKSNIPASFFALEPFVTEYFRLLGIQHLEKPRFLEAFRHRLGITERHK